jgi:hypothetical protein
MRRSILYIEGCLSLLNRNRIDRNAIAHGGVTYYSTAVKTNGCPPPLPESMTTELQEQLPLVSQKHDWAIDYHVKV